MVEVVLEEDRARRTANDQDDCRVTQLRLYPQDLSLYHRLHKLRLAFGDVDILFAYPPFFPYGIGATRKPPRLFACTHRK